MEVFVDLEKLQEKTLKILLKVDSICRKNNIRYYLVYGTALGAKRHGGFIPWDDDVDIAMFNEDFEKFKSVAYQLGDDFFLQTKETDANYPLELPKVRMNNTAFVEEFIKDYNINHGIFIDIFILEYALKNKFLDKLTQKIYMLNRYNDYGHIPTERSSRIIFKLIRPIFYRGILKKWWKNNIYMKLKKDYSICNDIFSYGYSFPSSDFGEPKQIKFENYYLPVPINLDNHLKICYGDYMKLPSVEKRKPHHNTIYFSADHNYYFYEGAEQ